MVSPTETEFKLEPPKVRRPAKRHWLPEVLEKLLVAPPTEECVTVTVVLRVGRTSVPVPVAWSPITEQVKKLHRSSWTELGVDRSELFRLKERIIRMARKEHERRAKQYATLDLFYEQ